MNIILCHRFIRGGQRNNKKENKIDDKKIKKIKRVIYKIFLDMDILYVGKETPKITKGTFLGL